MIEIRPGKDGVIPILPDIDFDNKIIVVVNVAYPVVTLQIVDYPEDMENYQNLFRCLATKCTTARNSYTYFIVFDNYQEYGLWHDENIQN
mgnify:CR=1 FL=1